MSEKAAKKKAPAKTAKKKAEPKEEQVKTEVTSHEVASMPPAPRATVLSRHEGTMHLRSAKGFSLGELAKAGIAFTVAKGLKLPLDIRRRSSLDDNVGRLKAWHKPAPKKAKEPKAEKKAKPAKKAKKAPKKVKKEQ